jgi:uncharacterized protein (TIGR00106 family)
VAPDLEQQVRRRSPRTAPRARLIVEWRYHPTWSLALEGRVCKGEPVPLRRRAIGSLYDLERRLMKATAELQVIPLGAGVSVRREITRVLELLDGHHLVVETHASGTDLEGELDDILAAVRHVHETLHGEGAVRLVSHLKLETRADKTPTLAGKRL